MALDSGKLLVKLQNTGLQNKDYPLYELLKFLIQSLAANQTDISRIGSSTSTSIISTSIYQQIVQGNRGGTSGYNRVIPGPKGDTGAIGAAGPSLPGPLGIIKHYVEMYPKYIPIMGNQGNQGTTGAVGPTGPFIPSKIIDNSRKIIQLFQTIGSSINLLAAYVATDETQASGAGYADLATAGPSVTITVGASGIAIAWITAFARHVGVGNTAFASPVLSGANTVAASDSKAGIGPSAVSTGNANLTTLLYYTGLTPGSTTFKLQYKNDGGATWNFSNRGIAIYCP